MIEIYRSPQLSKYVNRLVIMDAHTKKFFQVPADIFDVLGIQLSGTVYYHGTELPKMALTSIQNEVQLFEDHPQRKSLLIYFQPGILRSFGMSIGINSKTDFTRVSLLGSQLTRVLPLIDNHQELFKTAETILLDYFENSPIHDNWAIKTLQTITENPNNSIITLAQQEHYSRQQFTRKFKAITGVTPKAYQELVRTKVVVDGIINHQQPTELTFYDQSHLINNMRKYTGSTPTRLLSEIEPEVILQYRN